MWPKLKYYIVREMLSSTDRRNLFFMVNGHVTLSFKSRDSHRMRAARWPSSLDVDYWSSNLLLSTRVESATWWYGLSAAATSDAAAITSLLLLLMLLLLMLLLLTEQRILVLAWWDRQSWQPRVSLEQTTREREQHWERERERERERVV